MKSISMMSARHLEEILRGVFIFTLLCELCDYRKLLEWFYYLANGIYPSYKVFVKTLPETQVRRKNMFRI